MDCRPFSANNAAFCPKIRNVLGPRRRELALSWRMHLLSHVILQHENEVKDSDLRSY